MGTHLEGSWRPLNSNPAGAKEIPAAIPTAGCALVPSGCRKSPPSAEALGEELSSPASELHRVVLPLFILNGKKTRPEWGCSFLKVSSNSSSLSTAHLLPVGDSKVKSAQPWI